MNKIWRFDFVSIAGIFNLLRKHYPCLLFFAMFFSAPGWNTLGCAMMVLLLSQFIINIRQLLQAYLTLSQIGKDFLSNKIYRQMDKPFTRYPLSSYLDAEQMAEIFNRTFLNPLIKLFHQNMDEAVCIIKFRNNGNLLCSNLVCYARPMFVSYIFVKQAPTPDINPMEKLKIAHEIGHFALSPLYLSERRTGGILLFLLFSSLIYIVVDFHHVPLILIIAYVIVFLLKFYTWMLEWLPVSFKDEIYADLFSLYALTAAEKNALRKRFYSPAYNRLRYFGNTKMPRFQIEQRATLFLQNLDLGTSEQVGQMYNEAVAVAEKPLPVLFAINIFWCCFYLLPGFFISSETLVSFGSFAILNTVALIMLILLWWFNNYLDRKLLYYFSAE
jgi:hypothetical protein